jgi:hypothetical protein
VTASRKSAYSFRLMKNPGEQLIPVVSCFSRIESVSSLAIDNPSLRFAKHLDLDEERLSLSKKSY